MDKINAAAPNSKRCKRRKHTANPLRRRLRRRTTDDGGRTTDRGNRKENNNKAHNQLGEILLVLRAGATKMLRASFAGSRTRTHTRRKYPSKIEHDCNCNCDCDYYYYYFAGIFVKFLYVSSSFFLRLFCTHASRTVFCVFDVYRYVFCLFILRFLCLQQQLHGQLVVVWRRQFSYFSSLFSWGELGTSARYVGQQRTEEEHANNGLKN